MSGQTRIFNAKTITGLGNQSGQFNSDVIPSVDDSYFVGTAGLRWKALYTVTAIVSEGLQVGGQTQLSDTLIGGNLSVVADDANSGKADIGMKGDERDKQVLDLNLASTSQDLIAPRIEASAWLSAPLLSVMGYAVADQFVGTRTTDTTSSLDIAAGARFEGGMAVAKRLWAANLQADNDIIGGGSLSISGNASVGGTLSVTGNLSIGGILGITGNNVVDGNSTVSGDLTVGGSGTFGAGISVTGGASISGAVNTTFNITSEGTVGAKTLLASEGKEQSNGGGDLYVFGGATIGTSMLIQGSQIPGTKTLRVVVPKFNNPNADGIYVNSQGGPYNSNLIHAVSDDNTGAGNLILASSGLPTPTTKFRVALNGDTYVTGNMNVSGALTYGSGSTTFQDTYISGTTESTSPLDGALTVAGGVGIQKNLNVGGDLKVSSVTETLNSSTGSIVTAGGVGIGKSLNVQQNCGIQGNLSVNGPIVAAGNLSVNGSLVAASGIDVTGTITATSDSSNALLVKNSINQTKFFIQGNTGSIVSEGRLILQAGGNTGRIDCGNINCENLTLFPGSSLNCPLGSISDLRIAGSGTFIQRGSFTGGLTNIGNVLLQGQFGLVTAHRSGTNDMVYANFKTFDNTVFFFNFQNDVLTAQNNGRQLRIDGGNNGTIGWTIMIFN